jgi:hypothetical protein
MGNSMCLEENAMSEVETLVKTLSGLWWVESNGDTEGGKGWGSAWLDGLLSTCFVDSSFVDRVSLIGPTVGSFCHSFASQALCIPHLSFSLPPPSSSAVTHFFICLAG